MKKIFLIIIAFGFLIGGCTKPLMDKDYGSINPSNFLRLPPTYRLWSMPAITRCADRGGMVSILLLKEG